MEFHGFQRSQFWTFALGTAIVAIICLLQVHYHHSHKPLQSSMPASFESPGSSSLKMFICHPSRAQIHLPLEFYSETAHHHNWYFAYLSIDYSFWNACLFSHRSFPSCFAPALSYLDFDSEFLAWVEKIRSPCMLGHMQVRPGSLPLGIGFDSIGFDRSAVLFRILNQFENFIQMIDFRFCLAGLLIQFQQLLDAHIFHHLLFCFFFGCTSFVYWVPLFRLQNFLLLLYSSNFHACQIYSCCRYVSLHNFRSCDSWLFITSFIDMRI